MKNNHQHVIYALLIAFILISISVGRYRSEQAVLHRIVSENYTLTHERSCTFLREKDATSENTVASHCE